jgi:hypothetical protein
VISLCANPQVAIESAWRRRGQFAYGQTRSGLIALWEKSIMGSTYGDPGALIVCGDYEGDLAEIVSILNGFEFDQEEEERIGFVVLNGRIEPDRFGNDAASAFPFRTWLKSEDGRRILPSKFNGLSEKDREAEWDAETEIITLKELSKTIAPLLTRGTLELVAIRHKMSREAIFEKLAIRSDGRIRRQSQHYRSFERDKWHTRSAARFKPPKASQSLVFPRGNPKGRSSKGAARAARLVTPVPVRR